jgi:hypothetical protein
VVLVQMVEVVKIPLEIKKERRDIRRAKRRYCTRVHHLYSLHQSRKYAEFESKFGIEHYWNKNMMTWLTTTSVCTIIIRNTGQSQHYQNNK